MDWFNYYGLVFVTVLLIPNTVYAIKNKDGFNGNYHNKTAEIFEQIGRYACFKFSYIFVSSDEVLNHGRLCAR